MMESRIHSGHQTVTVALTLLYSTCFDTCTVTVIQVKTYSTIQCAVYGTNTILIGTYIVLY